jgi:plastocyanin
MRRLIIVSLALVPLVLMIGWAAAGAAFAGGGCHGEPESEARPSEAAATTVKIDGCTFAPTVARVPADVDVRFINSSTAFHDIVGRDRAWGTEELNPGEQYSHRFQDAGVYPFSCSLHPGMAGVIGVGSSAVAVDHAAQVTAVEPVSTTAGSTDSTVPMLAIGGISLLAGAALGALGARAIARRDDAA